MMMVQSKSVLAVVVMAGLLGSCNKKEEDKSRIPKQYTIEQLASNLSVSAAGFSADESKVLVSNNSSGIFNVYELNVADTTSKELTSSKKESFFAVDYLPKSDNYIYSADQGGDENAHLYLRSKTDSTAKDLTPWPKSANNFAGWSDDKKAMYVSSNKRDPKFFDIWKLETASWKPTLLFENKDGYTPSGVSKSERYVALTKEITSDKNDLYLYDRTSKTTKRLSNDNEAIWFPLAFEKNDSIMYYATSDGSEFTYITKYNINSGKAEKYFEDKWDVVNMSLSENEKYHTIFINDDGKNKVLLFDHASGKAINFPDIKDADVLNVIISPTERNMLLTVGSSTSPTNLYTYNFEKKELKQLTSTLNKAIDENDLVKAEVVRFKSFDGKEIPAIYYKPLQASKDSKTPALVWVHGGPGGQSRVGFSNSIQYLVNHGYAVLAVNNRGSSGYGKTFYKMDNKDHSNGDLKDCVWGKKWLAEQNYIDSSAIGIYGGSYGGCMVLAALAFQPDEFKVGVDLFGVANWLRTLRSIPPYWEAARKALYDELGDPSTADSVRLKSISPLFNYEKIKKPLIVFQGANDVRVLKVESDEIVAGVKKNGIPVEYVVYRDEGHGFVKKENQITTSKKTLAFLDKYLKTQPETK
ncbi:alpha/beta fold hydrolase [Dyadobacter sp. CY312]|uniref:S9 family peptidase n=1 Tax=Dyadobacter sp. CY312 TaxID=2907303 RepID=UPI001F2B9FC6|nr:alpha/beta fold hydrolase [Dyadobacter sp. CY312]MCE7042904.1 alpha/beta fold hydrolase [Dyadobacter sp. CY312]